MLDTTEVKMLQFRNLGDERGRLVVVEGGEDIPFEIKRVFYIYGSSSDVVRGIHANRRSEFILINVAGARLALFFRLRWLKFPLNSIGLLRFSAADRLAGVRHSVGKLRCIWSGRSVC